MKWEQGRQNTGYEKLKLFELRWPIPCDLYLLRYGERSRLPAHVDEIASGLEMWRLNATLRRPKQGGGFGLFTSEEGWTYPTKRINKFCSSRQLHARQEIEKGTLWVLSFGWLKRRVIYGKEEDI